MGFRLSNQSLFSFKNVLKKWGFLHLQNLGIRCYSISNTKAFWINWPNFTYRSSSGVSHRIIVCGRLHYTWLYCCISFDVLCSDNWRNWLLFDRKLKIKIRKSWIKYAGSLGPWDKGLVNQASDVPSIIFFYNFLQKSFRFIFLFSYNFTEIKIKGFECPNSIRTYEEKIMLGTSDTRLMSCSSHQPTDPSYWRLSDFKNWMCHNLKADIK